MRRKLSPKQKALVAFSLAALLWLPSGISEQTNVTTGHSTFYNGDVFDQCLASIAGIVRSRVMWFNDMVLTERYGGEGQYIYVTERSGMDPRGQPLLSQGVFYDFVDPNGAHWHVEESYIDRGHLTPGVHTDFSEHGQYAEDAIDQGGLPGPRQYVWTVELANRPIYDQFAGNDPAQYHEIYNFLILIDTCKMNQAKAQPGWDDEQDPAYNKTHTGDDLDPERGHPVGTEEHYHQMHLVDIYVGQRPTIALGGFDVDGAAWTSDWAASGQGTTGARNAAEEEAYQNGASDSPETIDEIQGADP